MIRTEFWGWEQPVIDRAVALLTQDWRQGELDLSDTLLIVPTAESGRRLKEALARATAAAGGAVSAPHVWPPERALLTQEDRARAASDSQLTLAWIKVLLEVDTTAHPHLFPVVPPEQSWAWAAEMANALVTMAAALGAGGLGFADVAASEALPLERDRWLDLASLESAFHRLLDELGVEDPQRLKGHRAAHPELPEGIRRILVLPSPDLPPLFRCWLHAASASVQASLFVQAPEALRHQFDAFGAPLHEHWGEQADLHLPLSNSQLHLEHDPAEQARRAMDLVREWVPRQKTALAVCDPEVTAHLEDRLQQEDVKIYEPGGLPAVRHGTVQMLVLWADFVATDGWQNFAALMRVPEVRDAFAAAQGASGMDVIAEADAFAIERLPVTLDHALKLMPSYLEGRKTREGGVFASAKRLHQAMLAARTFADAFSRKPLHEAARDLLVKLYGERLYQTELPQHRDHVKLCTDWLRQCEGLHREAAQLRLDSSHLLGLSVKWLISQRLTDPRGEVDLVLLGWLELLWEPAPALVIAGFNEEHVPGILISHPFLPDHLRQALGIASQASRFARDAYLLAALAGQRQSNGHLHLTCGQWSEGKDSLRPSRLLFLCEDKALPGRVRHLFPKDLESTLPRELPRQRAWKLKPRDDLPSEPLATISASRLGAYLRCPFTYYLDYVLGMASIDASKRELDALEYGNLIHAALTALQTEPGNDATALADLLVRTVEAVAASRHGARLPVPVEVQLDSACQRLRAAAGIEAGLRRAGWHTLHAEFDLGKEDDPHPLLIGGARFKGRIDRVDHHPDGVIRIIDYKTSDGALPPVKTHLRELTRRMKLAPEDQWKTFTGSDGRTWLWQDLQLPLYAAAWALREPARAVQTAYWNLPKAIDKAALESFPELDQTMIDAALACAAEAVRRINAGIFWPPAKATRFDRYQDLIHGPVMDAIEWEHLVGR